MNRYLRRAVIGAIAGGIASGALVATLEHPVAAVILGMVLGAGFAMSTDPNPDAYLDNMMTAGAYGVPLWGILSVIGFPLISGQAPEWSAEQMREHFPALVGWVLFGVALGLFTQLL